MKPLTEEEREARKKYYAAYYQSHRDEKLAKQAEYRRAYPEKSKLRNRLAVIKYATAHKIEIRARSHNYRLVHSERIKAQRAEYYRQHKAEINARRAEQGRMRKRSQRASALRKHYGLSLETYNAMLAAQSGVCAICGKTQNGSREHLTVDHIHQSPYRVRGLLCSTCNTALGGFHDDPALLEKAIIYLKR